MILIQVLTAMKNKYQLCKFQNWLFFGVFSSFSVWIMGFSGSQSAGTELGIWVGVTKPCQKDSCLFLAHTSPFHFPNPLKLQLAGLLIKWFCLWQTLIYWLCQALVTKSLFTVTFPLWWQDCSSREKTEAVDEELSQLWGLCQPDSHCNLQPPLQVFLRNTSESGWARTAINKGWEL